MMILILLIVVNVYNYYCYQAVEDCICKPIETQLCLYTVLPKCQNKFQPIFEI